MTPDQSSEPSSSSPGDQPVPATDGETPDGPGGVDAVPDWEEDDGSAVTPDPPRSAQVESDKVPGEIDEPDNEEPDSAGADDESPGGTEEPAD